MRGTCRLDCVKKTRVAVQDFGRTAVIAPDARNPDGVRMENYYASARDAANNPSPVDTPVRRDVTAVCVPLGHRLPPVVVVLPDDKIHAVRRFAVRDIPMAHVPCVALMVDTC